MPSLSSPNVGGSRLRHFASFVIEVTGSPDKVDAMARLLEPLGLKHLVRSGPLAAERRSVK